MATNTWTGAESNLWSNPNNWSLTAIPTFSDTAVVPNTISGCIVDTDVEVYDLSLDDVNFDDGGNDVTISGIFTISTIGGIQETYLKASGHWTIHGSGYCNIDHCGKLFTGDWILEFKDAPYINLCKAQDIVIKRLITNTPNKTIKWESYYGYQIFVSDYVDGDWDNATWIKGNNDSRSGWDYYNIVLMPDRGAVELKSIDYYPTHSLNPVLTAYLASGSDYIYSAVYDNAAADYLYASSLVNGTINRVGNIFTFSETTFVVSLAAHNDYIFVARSPLGDFSDNIIDVYKFNGTDFEFITSNNESTKIPCYISYSNGYIYNTGYSTNFGASYFSMYQWNEETLTLTLVNESQELEGRVAYTPPKVEGTNIVTSFSNTITGKTEVDLLSTTDFGISVKDRFYYYLAGNSLAGYAIKNDYVYFGGDPCCLLKIVGGLFIIIKDLTSVKNSPSYELVVDSYNNAYSFTSYSTDTETDDELHTWNPIFTYHNSVTDYYLTNETTSKRHYGFPYNSLLLYDSYIVVSTDTALVSYKLHNTPKTPPLIRNFTATDYRNRSESYTWKAELDDPIKVSVLNSTITNTSGVEYEYENHWISDVDGTWSNPNNWSLGDIPTPITDVVFNDEHIGECTLALDTAMRTISVYEGFPSEGIILPHSNIDNYHTRIYPTKSCFAINAYSGFKFKAVGDALYWLRIYSHLLPDNAVVDISEINIDMERNFSSQTGLPLCSILAITYVNRGGDNKRFRFNGSIKDLEISYESYNDGVRRNITIDFPVVDVLEAKTISISPDYENVTVNISSSEIHVTNGMFMVFGVLPEQNVVFNAPNLQTIRSSVSLSSYAYQQQFVDIPKPVDGNRYDIIFNNNDAPFAIYLTTWSGSTGVKSVSATATYSSEITFGTPDGSNGIEIDNFVELNNVYFGNNYYAGYSKLIANGLDCRIITNINQTVKLVTKVHAQLVKFSALNDSVIIIPSYTLGDWDNSTWLPQRTYTSNTSRQFNINAPSGVSVNNWKVGGCNNIGEVINATGTSYGNNIGIIGLANLATVSPMRKIIQKRRKLENAIRNSF